MFSLQTASPRRSCPSKRPSVCPRPGPNARRRPPRSFPLKRHGQPTGNPLGSERARCSSLHRVIPGTAPHACAPRPRAPRSADFPSPGRAAGSEREPHEAPRQAPEASRHPEIQASGPAPFPARARRHTRAAVAFAWNAGSKSLAPPPREASPPAPLQEAGAPVPDAPTSTPVLGHSGRVASTGLKEWMLDERVKRPIPRCQGLAARLGAGPRAHSPC